MEILSQASVSTSVPSTSGGTSGTAGNSSAGNTGVINGQPNSGFSAALNGMLGGSAEVGKAAAPQPSLAGLNALVQLIAALKGDSNTANEQSIEDSLKQLDALIKLLESNNSDAESLIENPDVQAWLAQIQALLQLQAQNAGSETITQTDAVEAAERNEFVRHTNDHAAGNGRNSSLFVPLDEAVSMIPMSELKPVSKAEARKLLESFKDLLQTNRDSGSNLLTGQAMQRIVSDLQQVLVPLLSADADSDPSSETILFAMNPKLEMLAAKALPPRMAVEEIANETPLFEPLQENMADMVSDNNIMPMHEYLKQVQSGEPNAKLPVLLMQAPTFAEDMAQFVVKSFTLDARAEGITEAKLSLYPQHLGQVDVKLTIQHGQLVAQFIAESSQGKEMLESQLAQLRSTLQGQGIQVDKLEVTQSQSFQSGMFQDQRQQQSQQSNKQQKGNGINKVVSLDEETVQDSVKSASQSGRIGLGSIDTIA